MQIADAEKLSELMEDCYEMAVGTKDGELLLIASGEDWYFYQGVPTESDEAGVEFDQRNGDIERLDAMHWPLEYLGCALVGDHDRIVAALNRTSDNHEKEG
jgi:hypothetical protein